MMPYLQQTHDLLLLTAAGFTKNFGGFLGDEMWSKVFNNAQIQSSSRLKELFQEQEEDDFEAAYSDVLLGKYSKEDKQRMVSAVEAAYQELDEAIKGWTFREDAPYPVNWYQLNELLGLFNGSQEKKAGRF